MNTMAKSYTFIDLLQAVAVYLKDFTDRGSKRWHMLKLTIGHVKP